MNLFNNPNQIPQSYGLKIAAGLIAYFLLMKVTGLNYFLALATGVGTSAIGSLVFALFLFTWMKLDSNMMQEIINNEPMGRYLNAYMASFIVALEGVFSGLFVTFVLINYINTDEVGGA